MERASCCVIECQDPQIACGKYSPSFGILVTNNGSYIAVSSPCWLNVKYVRNKWQQVLHVSSPQREFIQAQGQVQTAGWHVGPQVAHKKDYSSQFYLYCRGRTLIDEVYDFRVGHLVSNAGRGFMNQSRSLRVFASQLYSSLVVRPWVEKGNNRDNIKNIRIDGTIIPF